MYHRFNESKYPSTNIQIDVFKKQLEIIEDEGVKFIHPKDFKESLSLKNKREKYYLQLMMVYYLFMKTPGQFLKRKKYLLFYS